MAIQIHCQGCKSSSRLCATVCKKCGASFAKARKYRVVVKACDGKRISKVVETLETARKVEAKLKVEESEKKLLGVFPEVFIDDAWDAYLKWAEQNKKSWARGKQRWQKHISSSLSKWADK